MPTGFDGVADFDGNEIINANDIDLLAAQIEGDQDISFDLSLLSRFSGVVCELRATWWLGERGR